jgi:DNA (cytosine-5)-methyltransferase 1
MNLFQMSKTSQEKAKGLRTIDLFAGIGGIRLGFELEGYKTVFSTDFDQYCKTTFDENFDDPKLTLADITNLDIDIIPEFDVLLGGFPCQAFSIAGYRKGFQDEKGRGDLFFYIAKILEKRKPKMFLLENVKNLVGHDGGRTFQIIMQTLKDLGYSVTYKVLNTFEYGNLPQNRERTYIVGFLNPDDLARFEYPERIKLGVSVRDLLEKDVEEKYYYNGKPLYERIVNDVVSENTVYQWRRQYVRDNKKGICPTLTANMGMGGHNVPIIKDKNGIRKLTPRECFSIQGFPSTYKLPKIADSRLYKQAGNSVSVNVIQRIAEKMATAIEL